ncbi:MAG TPA: hypothetical protein VEJ38_08495 [Candidatus Acidoferrales bacterium]|nr:hypothetical protein [Candidatus Acidoferrales bacterium]
MKERDEVEAGDSFDAAAMAGWAPFQAEDFDVLLGVTVTVEFWAPVLPGKVIEGIAAAVRVSAPISLEF